MPRFAANLSMMFGEVPFLERFAAAAAAGFGAVEYLFPYEYPAETLAGLLAEHRLENVLFNLPPGNWSAGERGISCIPGREHEFRAGVDTALAYATRLRTVRLHAMAGIAPAGADPEAIQATYVANMQYAADQLEPHGITLLMEAINTRDMPGFYLNTLAQAWDLLTAIDRPNLALQIDCYHTQIMEGDLALKLRRYAPRCGHVQIAGVPERHEPDTGEIRYEYIFECLDHFGYSGWVGCEYRPAGKTSEGLGWFRPWSGRARDP
jgi:hydroxypyruvate isomerase